MTTQQHTAGIEVPDSAWTQGGAARDPYISPWYVATIKYADFDHQQGELASDVVSDAAAGLHRYTPRSSDC